MLSPEDNELLTSIGPGTPMGNLLRRFWLPGLLVAELPAPDCAPVRLRLLGEDLVAFCDSNGEIGILDAYCPHRRAHLYYGRNEECGLRCVYHGWKFNVAGQCIDMPSEPPETDFKQKIKLKSYSTVVRGNVIWVYMGPTDVMPEPPDFEWSFLPSNQRTSIKRLQQCNWAQAVEGGVDASHVSFLHSQISGEARLNFGRKMLNVMTDDRHPIFHTEETDYGILIGARRNIGEDNFYWRFTQCLLPFYNMIPPGLLEGDTDTRTAPYAGHAWVPIDDENTWTWSFSASPSEAFNDELMDLQGGKNGMWGPVDDDYKPLYNQSNDFGLDRENQRSITYTGIQGIPNQDAAVQESMGPIVDRSKEHLGTSDTAVIAWRKRLLKMVKQLEKGIEPSEAANHDSYNVRSVSMISTRDADWRKEIKKLMVGLAPEQRPPEKL
jgi:phthalate 4,5-dioxygenase oxygenase subunit